MSEPTPHLPLPMSEPKEPKTPSKPKPASDSTSIQSTPWNAGTAANAAARGYCETRTDDLVGYVEDDLQATPTVGFIPMLKALLVLHFQREVQPEAEDQGSEVSNEARDFAEEQLTALLEAAVDFCNDSNSQHSKDMKEGLEQSLSTPFENQRYRPLVQALNSILSAFHDTKIGKLRNGPDSLYIVNDPYVLRSAPLSVSEDAPPSKDYTISKPDIIDPLKTHLTKLLPENKHLTFSEWVAVIGEYDEVEKARQKAPKDKATSWGDISHCWELKRFEILTKAILQRLHEPYKVEDIVAAGSDASTPPKDENALNETSAQELPQEKKINPDLGRVLQGQRSSTKGKSKQGSQQKSRSSMQGKVPKQRSRTSTKESSSTASTSLGKRSRGSESGPSMANGGKSQKVNSRNSDKGHPRKKKNLAPEAQCAFYGIELLRSRWDRTHAIVILLKDNQLSLRWHDAQGCITTSPIDIVAQLPLLVVMILLFQRFGARMRGNSGINLEGEVDGNKFKYTIPDTAHAGWEMKGRRRVTATPIIERPPAPTHSRATRQTSKSRATESPLPPDDDLFFKLSWREEVRQREGFIIQTAKERAVKYLDENAGDVLNHLPDIKHSEDYPLFSTGRIRECLREAYALGRRSPKRVPFKDVGAHSLMQLNKRSSGHYLLWQIGIAHGDISLWNLMVKVTSEGDGETHYAILNDFDLATIMEPGQISPSKNGFERTGTKPFMAVELLTGMRGSVLRTCYHDLESIIWCLVWYCKEVEDWKYSTSAAVANSKGWWAYNYGHVPPEDAREDIANLWGPTWSIVRYMTFMLTDTSSPPTYRALFDLINTHIPYSVRPDKKEWDSKWKEWKVPSAANVESDKKDD